MVTRTWLGSKNIVSVGKQTRSLKYLALLCMDSWLNTDTGIQRELSNIAGDSPSTQV